MTWHQLMALCGSLILTTALSAQSGRPNAAPPSKQGSPQEQEADDHTASRGGAGRRELDDILVKGGFREVSVGDLIEWIASVTGKVVIPVSPASINNTKITLIIEEFVDKNQALDLIFTTFRLNRIGVIETEDLIIISTLDDMRTMPDLPVITADTDIMSRTDRGTMVIKIFRVKKRDAEGILTQIDESKPLHTSVSVDLDSNSIVVYGDIGYCQQVQHIINELDHKWISGDTITYRLAHADAQEIADNILELFDSSGGGSAARAPRARQQGRATPRGGAQGGGAISGSTGPEIEMRVTVNAQQNTVTVKADPAIIDQINRLIEQEWDLPRPETTTKVYHLQYTDPVKIRDTLSSLLGTGGGGGSGGGISRGANRPTGGTGGGASGAASELGNIYRIEAYPDLNSIIVIGKTEASFLFLDDLIAKLDRPSDIGLPLIVELNHADAVELSEELNALLQEAGGGIGLSVEGGGLTGSGIDSGGGDSGGGATGPVGREAEGARDLQFPWQRARQDDSRSPESPLIGTVRIMPIVRQNALAILCPPSQRLPIKEWIEYFDRPGRQVMITAIIAEVELTDDLSLGLRVSSDSLSLSNVDNAIAGTFDLSGQEDDFLSKLFDTSMLDLNTSVNVVLQALSQFTNVRILQEPAVFTADNQEAYFFDGQDIPFITDSQSTDVGGLNQSFEYRQVGVVLNVRPRITAQNDVDMEIYLELSSIVPGITLFGGAIIDRRSTTTQITVKNGQTIVISGILKDTETRITRKVPFLGDIPLIGELFTSRENQTQTSELVAFITPIVVVNPAAQEIMSLQNEKLLRELARPIDQQTDRTEAVRERMLNPRISPILEGASDGAGPNRDQPGDLRDDRSSTSGNGRKKK
ncbi:MAG: hypothetical protein O7G85_11175 [Planctomycetota bacterium]|nr:hypothetical protein [Planctomycetota bacterium]